VCVCVCVRARARVRVCVRACVRACVYVFVSNHDFNCASNSDGISHLRLFSFWTVPVIWCFESNTVVKKIMNKTLRAVGSVPVLRHTQLGPTRDLLSI
jgi:hypothetical protein